MCNRLPPCSVTFSGWVLTPHEQTTSEGRRTLYLPMLYLRWYVNICKESRLMFDRSDSEHHNAAMAAIQAFARAGMGQLTVQPQPTESLDCMD